MRSREMKKRRNYFIYGYEINEKELNPYKAITYIEDAVRVKNWRSIGFYNLKLGNLFYYVEQKNNKKIFKLSNKQVDASYTNVAEYLEGSNEYAFRAIASAIKILIYKTLNFDKREWSLVGKEGLK